MGIVKDIYRCLIGTILFIIALNFGIEATNAFNVSQSMNVIEKNAARQSCVLFSRETYKNKTGNTSLKDIQLNGFTVSGNVYGLSYEDSDAVNTYEEIMDDALSSPAVTKAILKYRQADSKTVSNLEAIWARDGDYGRYKNSSIIGKTLYSNLVTPLNLGITYLNKDIVTKMYKWTLASVLVAGMDNPKNYSGTDAYGDYILYKGLKVYVNDAVIENISYNAYDLSNESDAEKFSTISHIEPDTSVYKSATGMNERNVVVVAEVTHSVPIRYVGVTSFFKQLTSLNSGNTMNMLTSDGGLVGGFSETDVSGTDTGTTGTGGTAEEKPAVVKNGYTQGTSKRDVSNTATNDSLHKGTIVYYIMR